LLARDIVRLKPTDTEGVEIEQCGVTIRMVVTGIPVRLRMFLRQQGIEENSVFGIIAVRVADLRDNVNQAAASRASRQACADVERHGCFTRILQFGYSELQALVEILDFACEQKPPEPALLPARGFAHIQPAQDGAPHCAVTDPVFDSWKAVDVFQLGDEVRLTYENLLALIKLDTGAENFPRGIVDPHHLLAGIHVEVPEINLFQAPTAKLLEQCFPEGANDFSARAAQANDEVIGAHGKLLACRC
jgi:hypothetical protein